MYKAIKVNLEFSEQSRTHQTAAVMAWAHSLQDKLSQEEKLKTDKWHTVQCFKLLYKFLKLSSSGNKTKKSNYVKTAGINF